MSDNGYIILFQEGQMGYASSKANLRRLISDLVREEVKVWGETNLLRALCVETIGDIYSRTKVINLNECDTFQHSVERNQENLDEYLDMSMQLSGSKISTSVKVRRGK